MHQPESILPAEAAAFVQEWLGSGWTAQPLAGDASVRAYYRISVPRRPSVVIAYYPEELRGQVRRFLDAYRAIANLVPVPEILRSSESVIAQADAGDRTLFDLLHDDPVEGTSLYRRAVEILVRFQQADGAEINPPFNADFFFAEMEMAREYFVDKLMMTSPPASAALVPLLRDLARQVARHPYLLCHRDYHGQNINVINGSLIIIDYQDMRMGPDTYDLASLLRDRGVAEVLGRDGELALVDDYALRIGETPDSGLRTRYFETLLQRSIKILGTFSKMPIARGRLHYLDFIPPTLESVRRCLAELPHFAAMRELIPTEFSVEAARKRVAALA
ncbi:MAG TPA: phosphotransferase [Thermoanaerobaculia bacterium]|nr:phosphotransferase [Thermoanaerobaculia bacterium]